MNEFVLKEKHKYWDNKITLEEYIKDTEESGYIDCTGDYEYEYWYILENLKKLNNLQSKIDKANEILNKLCIYGYGQVNCRPIKNTTKQEVYNAIYEIKNILKEVENVKNN